MATFDAGSLGSGNASEVGTTLTISHTVANQPNRILLVGVGIDGSETISGVTYNSESMTLLSPPGSLSQGSLEVLAVYYKVAPATGANDIVVTLSGDFSGTRITAVGASFYGVDQTSAIAGQNSSTSANLSNPYSTSITTTFANQKTIDWIWYSTGSLTGNGTGQTQIQDQASGPKMRATYATKASAGANTMSYSTSGVSASVIHIVVALTNPNLTTSPTETLTGTDTPALQRDRVLSITGDDVTGTDTVDASIDTNPWNNTNSKNSISPTNTSKNSISPPNVSKNSSSWTNQSKS